MSSTNNITKVSAISTIKALHRKDKRRKAELGLAAATALTVGAGATLSAIKDKRSSGGTRKLKTKLDIGKFKEANRISSIYDNPDIPLSPEMEKHYEKLVEARNSIKKYKISANKTAPGPATIDKLEGMPQGIDMIGEEHGGRFVKELKPDSVYKGKLGPRGRGDFQMQQGGGMRKPIAENRKRTMNRIIMQEQLGDMGTETYFYRSGSNKPITISQQKLLVPKSGIDKLSANRLVQGMRKKGILPADMHAGNMGYDFDWNPKPLDLGHSTSTDYEKLVRSKKIKAALKMKNVVSPNNKRLYQKMAKRWAKRLPMIGSVLAGAGVLMSPNKAEAATDLALDMASGGVLAPSYLGNGELPPKLMEERRVFNAKRRLDIARGMKK